MTDEFIQQFRFIVAIASVEVIGQFADNIGNNIRPESVPFLPAVFQISLCRFVLNQKTGMCQNESPRVSWRQIGLS